MSRETLIKLRRGTAFEWASSNPILALGEPGFEVDTVRFKVGDGVTTWNLLRYVGLDGGVVGGSGTVGPSSLWRNDILDSIYSWS